MIDSIPKCIVPKRYIQLYNLLFALKMKIFCCKLIFFFYLFILKIMFLRLTGTTYELFGHSQGTYYSGKVKYYDKNVTEKYNKI